MCIGLITNLFLCANVAPRSTLTDKSSASQILFSHDDLLQIWYVVVLISVLEENFTLAVSRVLQFNGGQGKGWLLTAMLVACLCPIHVLKVSWEISLSARRVRNMLPLVPKTGFRFSLVCQIIAATIAGFGFWIRSSAYLVPFLAIPYILFNQQHSRSCF
jgi:hypothetical protein